MMLLATVLFFLASLSWIASQMMVARRGVQVPWSGFRYLEEPRPASGPAMIAKAASYLCFGAAAFLVAYYLVVNGIPAGGAGVLVLAAALLVLLNKVSD